MTKPFLIAAAFFLQQVTVAQAAGLKEFGTKEGRVAVSLSGQIEPGDADKLTQIIGAANAAGKTVSGIRLNSPGGNLVEGSKLADIIRNAKMATIVANGASCASACFVAFAAGTEKFVSNSATVGVHGASEKDGSETAASSAATIAMARLVKDLGVPAAVLGKMVVTPPSEIVWLTANDLRAMGTTMTGKPAQLAAVAPAAGVPPQQVAPMSGAIQANRVPTWKEFIDVATSTSARQHGGTAMFNHLCQPELKACSLALFYSSADGTSMMARVEEDINGVQKSRELCSFNHFGDVRKCTNWDTGVAHTDMKDAAGAWNDVTTR